MTCARLLPSLSIALIFAVACGGGDTDEAGPDEHAGESAESDAGEGGRDASHDSPDDSTGDADKASEQQVLSGYVVMCHGSSCPSGECQKDPFQGQRTCEAAYPEPIGEDFDLCVSGSTGQYAIGLGDDTERETALRLYVVSCNAGAARVEVCKGGFKGTSGSYVCT